jgi:hypothetical protein
MAQHAHQSVEYQSRAAKRDEETGRRDKETRRRGEKETFRGDGFLSLSPCLLVSLS